MKSNQDDIRERIDEELVNELENSSLSDEEAQQAEAFDASLGQDSSEPNNFEARHGKLASLFRLLHVTLGKECKPKTLAVEPNLPQRFRIVATLGQGGFGTVYQAYDDLLQRDVAIKVVPKHSVSKSDCQDGGLAEPRAVARLSHPNIVPLYEIHTDGERLCLISEYCEGPNLSCWLLEQQGAVDSSTAAEIVLQLSEAVAHAHSRGIVHRDIKSTNVLLAPNEALNGSLAFSPRLTDFGLGRDLRKPSSDSGANELVGTLEYMPPEQIAGGEHAGEAPGDIYALGVLLYRMLTGRLPHSGATAVDLMNSICTAAPKRVCAIRPDVSWDLEAICLKCLAKQPSHRYASAQGLVDDLRLWKSGRAIIARPRPIWEQCACTIRAAPFASAALALVICTTVAFTFVLANSNQKLTQQGVLLASALQRSQQDEYRAREAEREAGIALQKAEQQRKSAELHRKKALQSVYYSKLPQGLDAVQRGQFVEAKNILDEIRLGASDVVPLACDFQILQAAIKRVPQVVGHTGAVNEVLLIPNSQHFVTAAEDGIIRFHDCHTGQMLREQSLGPNSRVNALACSADGKLLAIGYATSLLKYADISVNNVTVVELDGWKTVRTLVGYPTTVEGLAFSPNSAQLAIGCRYRPVQLQSLQSENLKSLESNRRNADILYSPDGKEAVLFNGPRQLQRFDSSTGKLLQTVSFVDELHHIAWSPDGRWLAISFFFRPEVQLCDARDPSVVKCLLTQPCGGTQCIAFSPNGKTFAAGLRNGGIVSWELGSLEALNSQVPQPLQIQCDKHLVPHRTSVSALAVSDDHRMYSGSDDGSVALSDLNGRLFASLDMSGAAIRTARLSPDGAAVFLGCASGRLLRFTCQDEKLECLLDQRSVALTKLDITRDNQHLAIGWENGDVALLELPSLKVLREQKALDEPGQNWKALADLQIDPLRDRLAILRDPGQFELWEWARSGTNGIGTLVNTVAHQETLRPGCVFAFGSTSESLIYGGESDEFRRINTAEKTESVFWTGRPRLTALFSADAIDVIYCGYAEGRIEARSPSGAILAECAHALDPLDVKANSVDVTALTLSPDRRNLLSGTIEGEVRIWSAPDLQFLGILHARNGKGAIADLQFSDDAKRLLIQQALHCDTKEGAEESGTLLVELE